MLPKRIIKELTAIISLKYRSFKGVYLYGSKAKGTSGKDSDIDVVILFDSSLSNREQLDLAGIIGEVEYKYNVFIDYHPFTMSELRNNPFFYEEVVGKGIYYEAA